MNFKQLSVALPAVLLLLGSGAAKAGQTSTMQALWRA